jgi:hypothetical protein
MDPPEKTFGSVFLGVYVNSGLSWVQTVGCIWAIYGFLISNRKRLWQILFVHAITGLLGIFIQTYYWTILIIDEKKNYAILLGLNEIMWIVHESSVVLYSLLKLEPVITRQIVKKSLRISLVLLGILYAGFRIAIGVVRVQNLTAESSLISELHSYAFLCWGFADLVLFGILCKFTLDHWRDSQKNLGEIFVTLFKSSIPRFLILIFNTFAIVILGHNKNPSQFDKDLGKLVWAIKGTYPIILLFDLMSTKNLLLMVNTDSKVLSSLPTSDHSFGPSIKSRSNSLQRV